METNKPQNPAVQDVSKQQIQAAVLGFTYCSDDDEVWILQVQVGEKQHTVYVDTARIEVSNSHSDILRTYYNWNDHMLENCRGQVATAALLCAIATSVAEIDQN